MRVKIWKDELTFQTKILFYEEYNGKRYVYNPITKESIELTEGQQIDEKNVISVPDEETMQNMFQAISKTGVRSEEEYTLKGNLEATKYHLADLRKLLKLK